MIGEDLHPMAVRKACSGALELLRTAKDEMRAVSLLEDNEAELGRLLDRATVALFEAVMIIDEDPNASGQRGSNDSG